MVIIDPQTQEENVIVNSKDEMENFYKLHKNDIWVGFNSLHYDQWILKAILAGFNPKKVNDFIIVQGEPGWKFSSLLRKFPLNNYDVMNGTDRGLKTYEGFMGNSIEESSVPFDIPRKLTAAEIAETIKYCRHCVEQTIEVFLERTSDFEAQMGLLKMFDMPISCISKTKVQLSADILEAKKHKYYDEFDISFPPTMVVKKYHAVVDWYKKSENRKYNVIPGDKKSKKMQFEINVAGVPHVFGWGGVHGAREKYNRSGYFINMDVASLYPSLMIQYNLHSRSCNPVKFNDIVNTRLKYKAAKNPLQAPLKIVINGTYGAMKDKNNPLYDPRQANNVCVYGQLLLLDLIEKLEPYAEIIQSNTDGVLVRMPDGEDEDVFYNTIDDIANEWEQRTHLDLEFDEYRKVFQKDVNNYVIMDADGHHKAKGAYVKKLGRLDYDMAIVNKALVDYMTKGVPVGKTINGCDELKQFQQVKKISSKYLYILYNNEPLKEKCVRCFASKKGNGGLIKVHAKTNRPAKMEGTPANVFLWNGSIEGVKAPRELDKQFYINTALKRLKGFGVI